MLDWKKNKKVIVLVSALVCFLLAVLGFALLYQSEAKTDEIYKSALKDFREGKYQNSYYLFSKISIFSNLKPIAIYHRAECAKMLNDTKSEIKQYEFLFNNYPKHKLSLKAKYNVAQRLVKDKPQIAKRYFEQIIKYAPNTDYAIASEYYLSLILKNKYKSEKFIPQSVKNDIQNGFRHYIKSAPSGKWAFSAVNNWLEVSENISSDDYILMANTCYLFGEYKKAKELIQKAEKTDGWALYVKISYALKDYSNVKYWTEVGLKEYASYVSEDDIINAVDNYISANGSLDTLLTFAAGKGRDYLLSLRCKRLPKVQSDACYANLYLEYPEGRFSADALSNIFFSMIKSGNVENAIKVGKDHLNKFPNSNSSPMVMFWLGKIYEKTKDYVEYTNYYRTTIEKYPDSYYAYRAYLHLKKNRGPLINKTLEVQPVEYPYKYTKNNIVVKLVNLGDYDVVNELAGGDEFIKSWVEYEKGNYSQSVITARNAMDKLQDKPDKYDLRWRLVYPVLYYNEIKKYADKTGNSLPLMISLIREESYFDPLTQSPVGASGLMQLMPSTAREINSRFSLGLDLSDALFSPEKNIELGNYYYEFLRNNLEGYDVSAIAAYNGGIGSIKAWKSTLHYNDTDEFVEQIPYAETKNYVKKVFRSYWNYIRIY